MTATVCALSCHNVFELLPCQDHHSAAAPFFSTSPQQANEALVLAPPPLAQHNNAFIDWFHSGHHSAQAY